MPLVEYPPGGLTGNGERLGQQVIQVGAVGDALPEFVGTRRGPS
jgi:hypothetical protein